jgi:hypothetical protein
VRGWIAVYWLNLRAQRKAFQNQILDRARLEITDRVRDYQKWLSNVQARTYNLGWLTYPGSTIDGPRMKAKADELLALLSQSEVIHSWDLRLEEYQILFRETAIGRRRLSGRSRQIAHGLDTTFKQLLASSFSTKTHAQFQELATDAVGSAFDCRSNGASRRSSHPPEECDAQQNQAPQGARSSADGPVASATRHEKRRPRDREREGRGPRQRQSPHAQLPTIRALPRLLPRMRVPSRICHL